MRQFADSFRPVTMRDSGSFLFFISFVFLFCLVTGCFHLVSAGESAGDPRLTALVQRLIQDGFDAEKMTALFSQDSVHCDPAGVSLFFSHSEARLDYGQFLTKKSVSRGKAYLKKHRNILSLAQKEYGVDPAIITAILLVETRLGKYLGNRNVLNTLATMASLTDPALVQEIWRNIPESRKPSRQAFAKKVNYRCPWAYDELTALLKFTEKENIAPDTLKGSYAGAMGIPQFIPSKALALGVDGNGDKKVDLFTHSDAVFSVANYLAYFGWKQDMTEQETYKVLFEYNHSDVYVKTLMALAGKLSL